MMKKLWGHPIQLGSRFVISEESIFEVTKYYNYGDKI